MTGGINAQSNKNWNVFARILKVFTSFSPIAIIIATSFSYAFVLLTAISHF